MNRDVNRVVFYSIRDMSKDHNLKNAEPIIQGFKEGNRYDINDVIELYQIKLYFDNGLYHSAWNNETNTGFTKIVESFWDVIAKFFIEIDDQNMGTYFDSVDYQYYGSFWEILGQLNIHKKISTGVIKEVFESRRFNIRELLEQKKIVFHHDRAIRGYLMQTTESAELLLSQYEEDHFSERPKLFFPPSLTDKDKETLVLRYLDSPEPNLNYVRLVVKARTLRLTNKTKLKAKKLERKLNDEILEKGFGSTYRLQITISKDQIEPYKPVVNNGQLTHVYSEKWLDHTISNENIFRNFSFLFHYINEQGCIELVSKNHEIEPFERTFLRSKSEFLISSKFRNKGMLSHLQLAAYLQYLEGKDISIENVLSHQVNEMLNLNFDINGLTISFPSPNATPLEKMRFLAPELEFLIKQYQCFVEEGYIDFDLIKLSSSQMHLSTVNSKLARKYVYGQGDGFFKLVYYFFSRQSMLHYIEPYKKKYHTFYHLIFNEDVRYGDFEDYQKRDLDLLMADGSLFENEDGFLQIANPKLIFLVGKLYYEEVLNFWRYPEDLRNEILEMENKGMIKFGNTLFTQEEIRYLNFYLNQKFSNGLDLRNKYMHGTNTSSVEEQQNDYMIMLKLLILVIYKIRDDLSLFRKEQSAG